MNVLGIETSCDETAASVVRNGKETLSNIVSSSINFHKKYGGIVPEIAFRNQLESITSVVDSALEEAGLKLGDIKLISVTNGPGLLGSLLVGVSFAKALSLSKNIPALGVNHLYGHIYSSFLRGHPVKLPFVALIISGGHTSLFYVGDFHRIKILGATLDDACGETFDKVAKILGLGYPGGPLIEKLSKKGNPGKIRFKCCDTDSPLDFSFSGIKTAVLYLVNKQYLQNKQKVIAEYRQEDIAASFQESVINALLKKSLLACKIKRIGRLVVGGGVAMNMRLRERFYEQARNSGIRCYFPDKEFCMDNAAMVAGIGYQLFKKGHKPALSLNADLN